MVFALRSTAPGPRGHGPARDAWTAFWQDGNQSRCVAGSPGIWQSLARHWDAFSASLSPGIRILDIACGAGAVARLLLAARDDIHVTGIDFARIPLTILPNVELLSDTAMECLPFAEHSFGAAVSQFGFEYGDVDVAARELANVLEPGARVSMLVHHAGSSIVATNRARLEAINYFLGPDLSTAFRNGDSRMFSAEMHALQTRFPRDDLVAELARSLPSRLGRTPRERHAIWKAIEDALAPERCLAECLNACCVSPADLDEWLAPLRFAFGQPSTEVLLDPDGAPIAWKIDAVKGPPLE